MKDTSVSPGINIAKIPVAAGIAGAIFASGSMGILLIGIPELRYLFPAALLLGGAIAFALHFIRHDTPGAPWILPRR